MMSLKRRFLKKIINGFFLNFGGGRQINVRTVTESFASISATVYELSKNPAGGGQNLPPPPSEARVKIKKAYPKP